ncbi:MAG: ligase-associated DNA damage response endonuclease PdeM [Proteobacteria bacterium]|nr:ligase-associated DNA damage response endonuclease PdeM [Pseudomonadota bacterium]
MLCGDEHHLVVAAVALLADRAGALYWPEQRLLAIADLHLEKGSSFAARGVLLPPYDTAATLARLAGVIARYNPRIVVALGDSFHDGGGPARLCDADRATLAGLQRGREWVWIAGNHDPDPAERIGGVFAGIIAMAPLTFRHEPREGAAPGEIAGHLHPLARVATRAGVIRRRCFATDTHRVVMPAFGAYAGGLSIRDAAFGGKFDASRLVAHVLGLRRVYVIAAERCLPD